MDIIKTPFGEIDLDYEPISIDIQDSEIGTKMRVYFEGINSMTEEGQFANIVWIVRQYDQDGKQLNPLFAVQERRVVTPVSGGNRVTSGGILILREGFPEGEIGDRAYQMAMSSGHNEYKFWMALLRVANLPTVLEAAGNMLAQYNRYDRI